MKCIVLEGKSCLYFQNHGHVDIEDCKLCDGGKCKNLLAKEYFNKGKSQDSSSVPDKSEN